MAAATLSLCLVLSTLLALTTAAAAAAGEVEFVRSRCSSTDYPTLCVSSLSSYAPAIRNSPFRLAATALNVTLLNARSASTMMARLSVSGGDHVSMSSGEAEALRDCADMLKDAEMYLRQSSEDMGRMQGRGRRRAGAMGEMIGDVQTWVSTALTDTSTCEDGLNSKAARDSRLKSAMMNRVTRVAQLSSNALALVGHLVPAQ